MEKFYELKEDFDILANVEKNISDINAILSTYDPEHKYMPDLTVKALIEFLYDRRHIMEEKTRQDCSRNLANHMDYSKIIEILKMEASDDTSANAS